MRSVKLKPGTVLILVRHGESVSNASGTLGGTADTPLTPKGQEQAKTVAEMLDVREEIDLVVTSDMTRAHQTAAVIAERLGVQLVVEPGLREMNIGHLANLTVAEIRERMDEYFTAVTIPEEGFKLFGGESLGAFEERLIQSLVHINERWPGKRLVIVTHGGVINWLLQTLVGGEVNPLKAATFFAVRNCSPTRIRVLEGPDGQTMWRIDYVGSLLPL